MIYINTHQADEGLIIAMCDEGLIGKVLEEGDVFIDLKLYASFYKGELVKKEKAKEIIVSSRAKMNSANVVGNEAISIALESGIIERNNIGMVDEVPYAHSYKVKGQA